MKQTFLNHVKPLRYLAMLLIIVLSGATANAALESDDINAAILAEGSIPVKWTDDAAHPWTISEDGTTLCADAVNGDYTTTISMEYTSTYPTKVTFNYSAYAYYGDEEVKMIVDGEEVRLYSSSGDDYLNILPAGSHKIDFILTAVAHTNSYQSYLEVKNVRVWECKELHTQLLKEGSIPITFENDPSHPWIAEEGYIYSNTSDLEESSSKISTTFTIERASIFSYELFNGNNNGNYCVSNVIIDGVTLRSYTSTNWTGNSVVLYPGTHTVEFENVHTRNYNAYTQLRNIRLDSTWYDVTLGSPGELSVKLLQALGSKNLQDAELVKITGSLNETDWATIKQLSGIHAIDFTNTNIASIPNDAFRGLSHLSTVLLPETLIEIGDYAFYGTNFHSVNIPASVESIGHHAWESTPIQFITFSDNSKLDRIGFQCFYKTNLIEFIMPDSVTDIGRYNNKWNYNSEDDSWCESYLFYECNSLKKLHISESLSTVPAFIAYNCTALEEVSIQKNAQIIGKYAFYNTNLSTIDLPENLTYIASYAFSYSALTSITIPKNMATYGAYVFSYCENLRTVELNSHCWDLDYTFYNCTGLETIILPCATPPSIKNDPFYGATKSNVKLIVPDFALDSYRANSYWYNFTNTQAGDEASLNDYWAIRGNLTLDVTHTIQVTPSVEIIGGGVLTMDTDVQQNFNEFVYNNQESAPASYLSKSNNVKATKLDTYFNVEKADTWYFFSPVCDVKMSDVSYPATESWVIRYYDGARRATEQDNSGNWINVPADGTLHRGQGYIIQANAAGWLHMPVDASEHDNFFGANEVTHTLADNPSEAEAHAGWNFVANPYPSYYDIYYLNMEAPLTVWTGSTYRAYSLNDGDRGDDTFVLRPMQPFFVQKASADLTAGMPLTGRRTSTVIDRTRAPRRTPAANAPIRHLLNLELISANNEEPDDYTRIVLNEEASVAYEMKCDASKFMSLDNKIAQIYSLGADKLPMAINERPYENGTVGLGIYLPAQNETYRIAARRADRQAWLYDAENGIEHDLTTGDYVFTVTKTGFDSDRFSIRFSPITTGVEATATSNVKVVGNNGSISVTATAGASVAVYAADGSIIANMTAGTDVLDINVATGVYVVKVNGETFKTIVK